MKFKIASFFIFCSALISSSVVWAQAATVSETTQQMLKYEYNKKVLSDNSVVAPDQDSPQIYVKEREQIASQLQVITDNEDTQYTIVLGDTLTIGYKDRDHRERAAYKVADSGDVFIPLLGGVKVAGLNRRDARERINAMMKEYIRDPQVSITINTDGRFMIFGAISSPGIFDLKSKLSVMEAILSAGGFNRRTAELASVVVIRGPMEKPTMLKLNLKKMVMRGDRSDDILVKPGDFIYIPTSFISNLETFWNTAYGYLMQWYGLGGTAPMANGQWNWGGTGKSSE